MNHRVCSYPGKTLCNAFDSEDLGTSTKLYAYLISIPEKKISDVCIEDISSKVIGIANITLPEFVKEGPEEVILVQTDYGNGKLIRSSSIRLDQYSGEKAVVLAPLDKNDKAGVIVSLDKNLVIEMVKQHLSQRLDDLLLSIKQEEEAAVKLQFQIDSLDDI